MRFDLLAVSLALVGCGPNPDPTTDPTTTDATVVAATASDVSASQATLAATLDGPGNVAIACLQVGDPTEAHLLEATGTSTVSLRFTGLLAGTDYDCAVATTGGSGGAPLAVRFRTLDAAADDTSADATADGGRAMTGAYTVMDVKPQCGADITQNYIAVLDPDGNNRWRYDLPAGMNSGVEVTPDGPNRFLWGGGDDAVGAPAVVDVAAGAQWKLAFPGSDAVTWHHDVHRLADGRVLSVEQNDAPGWLASQLRLVDDAGATSWLWDIDSAVQTGWLPPGDADSPDPHHLNWADVVDSGDGLVAYMSLCYSQLVLAVDVASRTPRWRFGAGGDFALMDSDGIPLPDSEFPQCQHGLQMDGTHLLVYDNGAQRGYTRAVEYTLDTDAMVATRTWIWQDDPPFWEQYHGGVDWLTPDHARVLVAEGGNSCGADARPSQIVEVDRDAGDAEVQRLVLRDPSDWIYRAHRVDGCALFANAKYCPALALRLDALRPTLGL